MRWLLSLIASFTLSLAALGFAAEGLSFIFMRYVVQPSGYDAPGSADWVRQKNVMSGQWLVENMAWGPWHRANATARHEKDCFSVSLRSNAHGARDQSRELAPGPEPVPGVVVLGDSFTEGFGVEAEERFTDRLEGKLGIPMMNFGVSLDFGPLQQEILYDRLAANFPHDQVLIMFLPDNDLTDNDAEFWLAHRPDHYSRRYRPYYRLVPGGGYAAFYPVVPDGDGAAVIRTQVDDENTTAMFGGLDQLTAWFNRHLWTYRAAGHVAAVLRGDFSVSRYRDVSRTQLDPVLWSFKRIKERAGGRDVVVVVIPRLNDFLLGKPGEESPLIAALTDFGRRNGIRVIDLMPAMRTAEPQLANLFLTCDGHWSARGHEVATKILQEAGIRQGLGGVGGARGK